MPLRLFEFEPSEYRRWGVLTVRHLEGYGYHQRLCIRRASFWPFTALRLQSLRRLLCAYTHRIGRTGRAGHQGLATTFLSAANKNIARDLAGMLTSSKAEVPKCRSTNMDKTKF